MPCRSSIRRASLPAYGPLSRPNPRDATLILRDLALRVRYLDSPVDQARAAAILARPTDNPNPDDPANTYGATAEATPLCGANVCIHYVTSGTHAVDPTDWRRRRHNP